MKKMVTGMISFCDDLFLCFFVGVGITVVSVVVNEDCCPRASAALTVFESSVTAFFEEVAIPRTTASCDFASASCFISDCTDAILCCRSFVRFMVFDFVGLGFSFLGTRTRGECC